MTRISAQEWVAQRERFALMLTAAPLRARLLDSGIRWPMRLVAGAVAERTGRKPDDPVVRATAGAVLGVALAGGFAWAEDPDADVMALVDELMAELEPGL